MSRHHLHSSPETCHWGYFDAKLEPVLTIANGDEVTIETVDALKPALLRCSEHPDFLYLLMPVRVS
jgi:acetamidase/formamidase